MNEFALCIEYLLLYHDCIIVPGLGAFIAQHQEARYDEAEETLLPPYRLVRFNAELQHQDDLLCSSIQQIYQITSEEAEQKLGMWINEFTQNLEDCGSIDFGSIGVFTDDDDQIFFTPSEAGITTPEFYALDAVHIQQIPDSKVQSSPILKTDKDNITIRLNRHVASYIAAACIAILCFLSYSVPVSNTDAMEFGQYSTSKLFLPINLVQPDAKENIAQTGEIKKNQITKEESAAPVTHENAISEKDEENPCNYCIVVASAVTKKNAELYTKILRQRGYETARVLDNGRVIRVVIGSYTNEEEAGIAVRKIHRQSDEFKYAWVYSPKATSSV